MGQIMEAAVTWWKKIPVILFLCHAMNWTVQVLPSSRGSKRTSQLQQEPPKKQCLYLSGGVSTLTPIYPRQRAEVPWRYAPEHMTIRSNPMNLLTLASITLFWSLLTTPFFQAMLLSSCEVLPYLLHFFQVEAGPADLIPISLSMSLTRHDLLKARPNARED